MVRNDPVLWGRLLPVNEARSPARLDLADRRENFPASKHQGYIIGSDPECDLVIDEPCVSKRHCLIYRVVRNGQICVFLRDLSSNGTFINGNAVGCNQVVELKNQDEITIVDSARFRLGLAEPMHHTFDQNYTLLDFIRSGHLGQVFACQEKSTGELFAVKKHILSSAPNSGQRTQECIAAELNLMGLWHRNIMFMKEAFVDNDSSSHVTQLAKKGELFDIVRMKSKLSEVETRHIFKQLFDAVKYLHDRNIVHRDLKPENILVLDEEYSVLLCSFDLSITITTGSFDNTLCGTPSYVAPEILAASSDRRKYGREVDIWSLGVVLYICLCGFPPFSDDLCSKDFPYSLGQQIKSGKFDYPSPHWDSVGDPALDLIDSMLVVDPERRFTVEQCLAHPWLTQATPGQELLIKSDPALSMLGSGQVVPSSTYTAPLKKPQWPEPWHSSPHEIFSTSKTKGKANISSSLIKQPDTKEQGYSTQRNIHGEPRIGSPNIKTIEGIGNELEELTLDKQSSGPRGTAPGISSPASVGDGTDDLTSPFIYNESPDFNDSYDVSPNFGTNDFESGDHWFALFPDEYSATTALTIPTADQSPAIEFDNFKSIEKPAQRSKSSNSKSPTGRHSSVSGVNSRRRDKPLPPIIVDDPNDIVAMKRARNTLAARKARERKAMKIENLEQMLKDAKARNDVLSQAYDHLQADYLKLKASKVGEQQQQQQHKPTLNPVAGLPALGHEEYLGSQFEATPPARNRADPINSLEYDPFASLVNLAIFEPTWPWTPSTELSEDLQNDIEFNDRGQDLSNWTCTPSKHVPSHEVPLRVDGHPVVLPVEYKYPLTGMFSPPPDPHPRFISPYAQLSDEDIHQIFSTFPACVGFYLLINGFLQIIMPDDFDYEEGVPSLPSEFGGLKVSLIPDAVCPTAGEASASSPAATTTSTRTRFERMFGQSPAQSSVAGPAGHPSASAAGISVGSTVRAIVPGSKSKQRFEGKIGVAVTWRDDNSKKYVTIPTHLLTDAVIASKTMSLDSNTWKNEVKLGEITAIFDRDPKSFPIGFSHDVSLVDISGIPDAPRTIPYATNLTWLSQQEWMDIKYNSSKLVLLDDRSREAKSIGVVDSRCQMVGQGIFRIQQQSRKRSSFLGSLSSGSSSSRAQDPRDDPSTWTSLVARSILYRVHPDYPARGGQSGVPVCVVSESTDGVAPRSVKVAGFASFVQMVSDVQKYDLEGDRLYKRLQEGRVAFYGAFQVPQELREGYQIL